MTANCQYCGLPVTFSQTSNHIHGRNYGPIWECVPCAAYVGCHKGTTSALGTVANKATRDARQAAHKAFDGLWKCKVKYHGWKKQSARGAGYKWLAKELGIDVTKCHIANFDEATCLEAVRICTPYLAKLVQ